MEGYLMVVPRKAAKKVRNQSVKSGTSCIGHGCNIDGSKSTQKAGRKELISWSRITFVQILNSFLIVIMAPITIQQTHLRLETCIPIIYYPLDAFPMWLAQVFVEASCSIQLPEPASRISPRPRSVDFRWSWEAPEATFTTKPGLPSQLRPLHSGGPASRLRVFRRITKKHSSKRCNRSSSVITDLLLDFSRTKSLASTSGIPPSNFPPPPLPFLLDTTAIQGTTMVWHGSRVLLQSRLKKFHCPPEASRAIQLWSDTGITPHLWHKISLDIFGLQKREGWNKMFHKKEMNQS